MCRIPPYSDSAGSLRRSIGPFGPWVHNPPTTTEDRGPTRRRICRNEARGTTGNVRGHPRWRGRHAPKLPECPTVPAANRGHHLAFRNKPMRTGSNPLRQQGSRRPKDGLGTVAVERTISTPFISARRATSTDDSMATPLELVLK